MKSVYLFCSKPWVYLTEIPAMIILWISLSLNDRAEGVLKFYPLIIFSSLMIVFIMIYFFRAISISTDEIRYHGLFSSKDSALISENKTLRISIKPHFNLGIELFGDAGEEPAFDWMKAADIKHRDICIFRGKAVGGKSASKKIVRYFTGDFEIASAVFHDGYTFENEDFSIKSEQLNEVFTISIKFKKTII